MICWVTAGKFYELFDEDADLAVREIGLGYMGKQSRPHAGFPEQAYSKYSTLLAQRGINFVRVEQTETPAMLKERNDRTGRGGKQVIMLCMDSIAVMNSGCVPWANIVIDTGCS